MRLSNEVAETMFIGKEPNSESNKNQECLLSVTVSFLWQRTTRLPALKAFFHLLVFKKSFSHGKKISDTITVAFSEVRTR